MEAGAHALGESCGCGKTDFAKKCRFGEPEKRSLLRNASLVMRLGEGGPFSLFSALTYRRAFGKTRGGKPVGNRRGLRARIWAIAKPAFFSGRF